MSRALVQLFLPFAAPAAILVIALLTALAIPRETEAAVQFFPGVTLLAAIALSVWFNRGRAFLAATSLALAWIGCTLASSLGHESFAMRAMISASSIFVPINIALILILPERGVLHFRSYRWMLLIATECLLSAWIASAGHSPLSGAAWQQVLNHWLLRPDPTPLIGRLAFAAGISCAIGRVYDKRSPVEIGLGSALVAFFIAFSWHETTRVFSVFLVASGLILMLAVLQESHRMAYLDELTGLPGRRTLEEQLLGLGPSFAIAMVDVDHFKKFNDTHGHDVGDQVLRMVGARLAEVGGGGRAYRYGGEEFSILFADKNLEEVLPHLEALRTAIAHYELQPRIRDRRQSARDGDDRRLKIGQEQIAAPRSHASDADADGLSVTISIGVAERNRRLHTPAMVLRAADEALYRAKSGGRNRVNT